MTRLKYCHIQGKVRYPTYYSAARVLKAMTTKHHHNGGSCYFCQHCHAWHITHFTDVYELPLYYGTKRLNKKQLKSIRLRERKREKREARPMKGEQLHDVNLSTMRIIPIQPNADLQKMALKLSTSFGELKMFVGGTINCALFQMHEAMVMLQQCPEYRHAIKKQFKQARAEWDRYERELKHPNPNGLRFFCLQDMDPAYRKRYADAATDEQYFELWQGTGFEMYNRCKDHITALTYKFEKYLTRVGATNPKAYAAAMTADALLQLAVIVFELMAKDIQTSTPYTTPSFIELSQPLNPERIQKAFSRGLDMIALDSLPCLTEEETRNVKLTTEEISHIWSDPLTYIDIQQVAIEDYSDDVFRTKGEAKKLIRLNSEKRAEIERKLREQKKTETTNKIETK